MKWVKANCLALTGNLAEAPAEALEISPEERVLISHQIRARSSMVERCPDKTEADGSIPSVPTKPKHNRVKQGINSILKHL